VITVRGALPFVVLLVAVALLAAGDALEPQHATRAALAVVVAGAFVAVAARLQSPREDERPLSATRTTPDGPHHPSRLVELEVRVRWCRTQGDVHYQLRPVMRETAQALLRERHGVTLDRQPELGAALLGDHLYELVRADRPAPADRRQPSTISQPDIAAMVQRLERL
jgi:hypothetical protein